MKRLFAVLVVLGLMEPVVAQQLLVLKSNKRLVVKVHQESGASVYYSEWPDTTKANVKAVLQDDIKSLTMIQASEVDSMVAVISSENYLREQKEEQEQKKWFKKNIAYSGLRRVYGWNKTIGQEGLSWESGIERKNKFRIGFVSGVERINIKSVLRGIQTSFSVSAHCAILNIQHKNQIYALTNVGYNFVLNEDDKLRDNKLWTYGMGVCLSDTLIIEVYYKMQRANSIYQQNGRADLIGVNFGVML